MVYNLQKPPADLQSQTVALLKGEKIDYVLPTFTFLPLHKARFLLCAVSSLFFYFVFHFQVENHINQVIFMEHGKFHLQYL